MDQDTRNLLLRWRSLESDDGLKNISTIGKLVRLAAFTCCLLVVFGGIYGLHRAAIALLAAIGGWLIAEGNALQTRMAQWPIFKQYINWERVAADLGLGEETD